MSVYPESHLTEVPPTLAEVFAVPAGYTDEREPNIERILQAANEGPVDMALVAAGEAGAIVRADVYQHGKAELLSILEASVGDSVLWPARKEFLEQQINRHSHAMIALEKALGIYQTDYTVADGAGKIHTNTERVSELFDKTEEVDMENPVLRLLLRIRALNEDSVVEDRRTVAERLVRIIVSGEVDEKLATERAERQKQNAAGDGETTVQ